MGCKVLVEVIKEYVIKQHYDENSMEALRGNNINNINMEIVSEHSDFVSGGMLEMLLPNHKMKRLRKEDEEQKDAEDDNDDAEEVEDNALNGVGADDSSSEQHNNTTSISPQPTINMNKQIVSLTITSKID